MGLSAEEWGEERLGILGVEFLCVLFLCNIVAFRGD